MNEKCPDCESTDLSKRPYLYRQGKPLYYCYGCGIKFNTPQYGVKA